MREAYLAGGWSVRWLGNLCLSAVLRGPDGQSMPMDGADADAFVGAVTGRIQALSDALAEAKARLAQGAAHPDSASPAAPSLLTKKGSEPVPHPGSRSLQFLTSSKSTFNPVSYGRRNGQIPTFNPDSPMWAGAGAQIC